MAVDIPKEILLLELALELLFKVEVIANVLFCQAKGIVHSSEIKDGYNIKLTMQIRPIYNRVFSSNAPLHT